MTTKEFIKVAEKINKLNIYYSLKKGEHGIFLLGLRYFGSTPRHYAHIWRTFGTIENIVITKTAEEVNDILIKNGISEFYARPTKSNRFCRLIENKQTTTGKPGAAQK